MGNRGTTPSGDDEQIAIYGLDNHLRMSRTSRADRRRRAERDRARLEFLIFLQGVLALKQKQETES